MSRVVAIGDRSEVAGFALAGVELIDSPDADAVRRAIAGLPSDVSLVILTSASRAAAADELADRPELLWTVLPS